MALDQRQRGRLADWLPGAEVLRDHSWGLIGTTVLELRHEGGRYIVKAAAEGDHHLGRELRAHENWLAPWTSRGAAPELVHADPVARMLVTRFLPGELVQGHEAERDPETYRQAGRLLALLHGQSAVEDPDFEAREREKALRRLDEEHRIDPVTVARLRAEVASWPTPPVRLVPTHGDWQPRNWLVHEGVVRVIDFGRADLRPAASDFGRLAAQQFRADRALEAAFLRGYGGDPREAGAWHRDRVREAMGTAVWAYQVGSESFERQGHRMTAEVL